MPRMAEASENADHPESSSRAVVPYRRASRNSTKSRTSCLAASGRICRRWTIAKVRRRKTEKELDGRAGCERTLLGSTCQRHRRGAQIRKRERDDNDVPLYMRGSELVTVLIPGLQNAVANATRKILYSGNYHDLFTQSTDTLIGKSTRIGGGPGHRLRDEKLRCCD